MKKIVFLVFALFLMNNVCFSQENSQENGVVSYTITSNWTKMYAACTYLSKADRDRTSYVYGAGREGWDSKAELKFSAGACRYENKENEEYQRWRKDDDYIIYRNLEEGTMFDVMTLLGKEYVIQDSIICQNWKIKNDLKEIAGHICMNAFSYDSIKGKEVIAWFALDLPISIGPDRYCGLPGMILELDEANGAVVYTATTVLFSDEKMEIEKPVVKKKRKAIDNEERDTIVSKHINECKKMQRPYFWYGMGFK
jgi:GLPGLI family protein